MAVKKGNIIIKNANQLVTFHGYEAKAGKGMSDISIIPNGALVVTNGKIEAFVNSV